jgi:hypothetical protein
MTITEFALGVSRWVERRAIGPDNVGHVYDAAGAVIMRVFDARRASSPHSRCLISKRTSLAEGVAHTALPLFLF